MELTYELTIRTLINKTEEELAKLCFERREYKVAIFDPMHLALPYRLFSLSQSTEPPQDATVDGTLLLMSFLGDDFYAMQDLLEGILYDLLAWIRVLTRQFWVGYKECGAPSTHGFYTFGDQERRVLEGRVTVKSGFTHGKKLDSATWAAIGEKLAAGEHPPVAQQFYCDALLRVSERDMRQAVIALGIACELKVRELISDALAAKHPFLPALLEKYGRFSFQDSIKSLIRDLDGQPFSAGHDEANKLVNSLYEMRGKAAHKGACTFDLAGKRQELDVDNMGKFFEATDALFTWCDEQRNQLTGQV